MLFRASSLRLKLTLLYVLIFGLLQVGFWITVDVIRCRFLFEHFDQGLLGRARSVIEAVESASENTIPFIRSNFNKETLEPFATDNHFIQVSLDDGEILGQTANMTGVELPLSKAARDANRQGEPMFETLAGPVASALVGADQSVRVVAVRHRTSERRDVVVQVAASLAPVERIVYQLRRFIAVFFIVSITFAVFTSWYMVGRSLAPVRRIARHARRLTASRLHERIPVPESEDEIREMTVLLNEMLDRLETQFRNQRQFLSRASHELKTPITVLLTEARAFSLFDDPEATRKFAKAVLIESGRMSRIVDAFLLLSRSNSGGGPSVRVRTPIEDIILSSVKSCEPEASVKGVRLITTLHYKDEILDPAINGDTDLLISMLENVIRNAVRYSPDGGAIEVEVNAGAREAAIHVRDEGPGVPPDQLNRIFEIFYQLTPSDSNSGLLGIGLNISKSIAELHGGSISCRNRPEKGCEFIVRLPLTLEDLPAERG